MKVWILVGACGKGKVIKLRITETRREPKMVKL